MLIPIVLLMGMVVGLFYGVYQEIETAAEKKRQRQIEKIDRKRQIELEELKELDFLERLETMENESVFLLDEIAKETDPNKVIKLHKELQRVQKQRYITKYKETS